MDPSTKSSPPPDINIILEMKMASPSYLILMIIQDSYITGLKSLGGLLFVCCVVLCCIMYMYNVHQWCEVLSHVAVWV
uniref:Uncharacterized protein n=1 Tax=Oryza brachyantha TaxID=4533 RepID=J3M440_ORYBR